VALGTSDGWFGLRPRLLFPPRRTRVGCPASDLTSDRELFQLLLRQAQKAVQVLGGRAGNPAREGATRRLARRAYRVIPNAPSVNAALEVLAPQIVDGRLSDQSLHNAVGEVALPACETARRLARYPDLHPDCVPTRGISVRIGRVERQLEQRPCGPE